MSTEKTSVQHRKRSRRQYDEESDGVGVNESNSWDEQSSAGSVNSPSNALDSRLFEINFPREYEMEFATTIFELGLKHSSPKVLIPLMPRGVPLNTEHIKSHLQKYRIHRSRSKEEFQDYYDKNMKDLFRSWDNRHGWEANQHNGARIGTLFSSSNLQSQNTSTEVDYNHTSGYDLSDTVTTEDLKHIQLRQKLKQLSELQAALMESTALLSEWSNEGKEILERSSELRREVKSALTSVEENQHIFQLLDAKYYSS